jgi:redox-sensitive bicupin YhaK (pirin superfamily)
MYFDVELPPDAMFQHRIAGGLDAFVYTYEGELSMGEPPRALPPHSANR